MPRRILITDLHPGTMSLVGALAQACHEGATAAGHQVRALALSGMAFDPDLGQSGFRGTPPLEPDLVQFLEALTWAEHWILLAPMWWGGLPARAKGLLDRTLLPGFAFDPRQRRLGLPKPLLGGRSARVILTSDTPGWAFGLLYRSALRHQLQRQILGYVGIRPSRFTMFAPVEHSTDAQRTGWLQQSKALGAGAR